MTFKDGTTYEGLWDNGKQHGKGIFRDVNGNGREAEYEHGELVSN